MAASRKRQKKYLEESLRLQKRLRRLAHRVLAAQEDERRKISHELQDEIAQTLLGIKVRLLNLKTAARAGGNLAKEIASTQRLVVDSIQTINRFADVIGKRKSPAARFVVRSARNLDETRKQQPRAGRASASAFLMNRATPMMRSFAKRLIAFETKGNGSSRTTSSATFLVIEKLRPHFTTLMGNAGFRALLSRALALAGAEVRWLNAVHVHVDGSLAGLDELAQIDPEKIAEGGVVLIAQLLGLLVAFIGEKLTLQIMRDVWPKLSLDDLNFDEGNKK